MTQEEFISLQPGDIIANKIHFDNPRTHYNSISVILNKYIDHLRAENVGYIAINNIMVNRSDITGSIYQGQKATYGDLEDYIIANYNTHTVVISKLMLVVNPDEWLLVRKN